MRGGIALTLAVAVCFGAAPAVAGAKTRTLTMRFGPVKLNGYETGTGNDRVPAPRVNGHVTSMYAHLVDRAGRPIPQQRVMLHHVFFANEGHPGHGDCAPASSETFYGTGEEDQRIELPAGYGYRVRSTDRWRLGWMFMNHRHNRARVYLKYTVTISDDPGTRPVTPYWISVSCAGSKIYSVPGGGGLHRKSRTWTVPESGRIVAGAAHAHGGAHQRRRVERVRRAAGLGGPLRRRRRSDLQPVARAARALAAQHERGDVEDRLGGHARGTA